jgi:hypothetical protein|tara:strand:+ start:128 stop:262 length:135 start_codon:yes stop_codon:yes gene_type:complete
MQYFKNKKTYYHERTRRRLEVDVKEEKEDSGKAKSFFKAPSSRT